VKRHFALIVMAVALLGACAGYNLVVGTSDSDLAGFHQVYEMPASSLKPWSERRSPLALPPPPVDGSSGASTLPANTQALPTERPQPAK
jgi:hypothetical protein